VDARSSDTRSQLDWRSRGSTRFPPRDYNDHILKSTTIGIREAKAQLSRLVSEAEQGADWIITDRGRPVAKLSPVRDMGSPVEQRLGRLQSWGWVEPVKSRPGRIPPPLRIEADAQRALQDDRGA
jgi:prevent-host-death family protein